MYGIMSDRKSTEDMTFLLKLFYTCYKDFIKFKVKNSNLYLRKIFYL